MSRLDDSTALSATPRKMVARVGAELVVLEATTTVCNQRDGQDSKQVATHTITLPRTVVFRSGAEVFTVELS